VNVSMKERKKRKDASDNKGLNFDSILSEYKDRVFALCFRMLGDYDDADDCAQEVFVKMYRSLDTFRGESKLSTWIYRVAYNTALDAARSRKRKRNVQHHISSGESGFDIPDERENPESKTLVREQESMIQTALLKVPADQRSVVVLCDIEGRSYEEIALIAGISTGTVKSRIARGREKLREILRGEL
jgi:RNA polymerase sigma-70 factor, ECF subfamily